MAIQKINSEKNKNAVTYGTYILTAFETEIERHFNTKKEMLYYLANELWVKPDMDSIAVVAFTIDEDGDKTFLNTKYSFDKRSAS